MNADQLTDSLNTPGDDFELAAGFLFTEGIIKSADQINQIKHCGVPAKDSARFE